MKLEIDGKLCDVVPHTPNDPRGWTAYAVIEKGLRVSVHQLPAGFKSGACKTGGHTYKWEN